MYPKYLVHPVHTNQCSTTLARPHHKQTHLSQSRWNPVQSIQMKSSPTSPHQIQSDQSRSNQVQSVQIKSSPVNLDQIQSNKSRSNPVRPVQFKSSPVSPDEIKSSQSRSNPVQSIQIKSSPTSPDQIQSSQSRSNPVQPKAFEVCASIHTRRFGSVQFSGQPSSIRVYRARYVNNFVTVS